MSSSRLKNHTVLTVIIRSGSIHARVFSVDKKGGHIIHKTHIEQVYLGNVENSDQYTEKVELTVKNLTQNIVEEVRGDEGPEIDFVAVFYSSPWFTSEFRSYPLDPEIATEFTKDTMKEILIESSKTLKDEYKENTELKPIEQHISTISLNGYNITDPYGKVYTSGSVDILTTWVSKKFQDTIISAVKVACQHSKILHFSFPYILMTTLDHKTETRFCVLDVHSEITDIIFMKNSIVETIESVPVGTNHLLKAMNQDSFGSAQDKRDFLEQLNKKYLDPSSVSSQKKVCEAEILRWYESLMNVQNFNTTESYTILAEQPFRFLFEQCLEKEKGVRSLYLNGDVEENHIFGQTDIFWHNYIELHPEHLERLQK